MDKDRVDFQLKQVRATIEASIGEPLPIDNTSLYATLLIVFPQINGDTTVYIRKGEDWQFRNLLEFQSGHMMDCFFNEEQNALTLRDYRTNHDSA